MSAVEEQRNDSEAPQSVAALAKCPSPSRTEVRKRPSWLRLPGLGGNDRESGGPGQLVDLGAHKNCSFYCFRAPSSSKLKICKARTIESRSSPPTAGESVNFRDRSRIATRASATRFGNLRGSLSRIAAR